MEGWMVQMRWTDRIDRWAGGKMNEQTKRKRQREGRKERGKKSEHGKRTDEWMHK